MTEKCPCLPNLNRMEKKLDELVGRRRRWLKTVHCFVTKVGSAALSWLIAKTGR